MILVLADDLSGAAELGALARRFALTAQVQRHFEPSHADVICLNTQTRSGSAAMVREALRRLLPAILQSAPSMIYKKTDSVLRGPIRAEISQLLEETGNDRALLVPANPSMGRTIRGGKYFISGIPLDATNFQHDREYPARSADVAQILARDEGKPIFQVQGEGPWTERGIIIPDAETIDRVEQLASRVDVSTLPAGASDFFHALLKKQHRPALLAAPEHAPAGRLLTLFVCGSEMGWQKTLLKCQALKIPSLRILEGSIEKIDLCDFTEKLKERRVGLIGLATVANGVASLGKLAAVTRRLIESHGVRQFFVEGGGTGAALAAEMGWNNFSVERELAPGVALMQTADHFTVAIKPGSYPWPESVWDESAQWGRG